MNTANPEQASALDAALLGRTLEGRYAVQSRLAQGGMATVYRAWDNRLDRLVALKVMQPELAVHQEYVHRFIREAKAAAKLAHPNIVAVFDQSVLPAVGGGKGLTAMPPLAYLAMEYVPGLTLRQLLGRRGRFSPREALEIVDAVLAGLAAAHRAGIVHRDVKPENVLLSEQALAQHGTFAAAVKVTDFGLARSMSADDASTLGQTMPGGGLMGTVSYLAPELVRDGTCDARSDVYSAGIVLFELLTGRKPFVGGTPMEIAHRHVSERVPAPSGLVPGLDPALDALVARATAREPENRPPDAAAFRAQLRSVYTNLPAAALDFGADPGRPTDRTVVLPVNQVIPDRTKVGLPPAAGPRPPAAPSEDDRATVVRRAAQGGPFPPGNPRAEHTRVDPGLVDRTMVSAEPLPLKVKPRTNPNQPYELSPGGRRKRSRRGLYILIGVLVLALTAGLGAWYYGSTSFKKVPSVSGLGLSSAESALTSDGFQVSVSDVYNSTVQSGAVIGTNPGTGSPAKAGSTVTIDVSKGPAPATIPSVTGETQGKATADLTSAGFKVGISSTTTASDSVPSGSVVSYTPTGSAVPGTVIVLTLSSGPAQTLVPDVTGLSVSQATAKLQAAGFKVSDEGVTLIDDVFRQSPGGNSMAPTGSTVTIYSY
ncbi:MAG TPA: Stk1 family PASTA domain-containing Ser/Thr kinase [Actinocrinis sp.]|nr:Stk1 family PASTA domain-containing Ser/Thr kinase [Actinocrinis sp.]